MPFTSGSSERTFARIAFSWSGGSFARVSRVYEPIGTVLDPITTFTPFGVRPSIESMSESLGTASTKVFVANSTGWPSRPS